MDKPLALRLSPRAATWPGRLHHGLLMTAFAGIAVVSLWRDGPARDQPVQSVSINQLVHWQDAEHDWLLVVDPETRELVVYDAANGRPLERLGADDGLPQVQSIALKGPRLFVTGSRPAAARQLSLPTLRTVAVNAD